MVYLKREPNKDFIMEKTVQYELQKNIKRVGHIDIPGGGQIVVDGNYAYVGHMKPPHGTTILDVADPKRPKIGRAHV